MNQHAKSALADLQVYAAEHFSKPRSGNWLGDVHWRKVVLVTDALEDTDKKLRQARADIRAHVRFWDAWNELKEHGMQLLKEHYESNDPYVDDYPSARAAGAEHRKTCRTCAVYGRYLRTLNETK